MNGRCQGVLRMGGATSVESGLGMGTYALRVMESTSLS